MRRRTDNFFRARALAKIARVSAKTIHRLAMRECWPRRVIGNRFEYSPSPAWRAGYRRIASARASVPCPGISPQGSHRQAILAFLRWHCLAELAQLRAAGVPVEISLVRTAAAFRFKVSPTSLRRWDAAFCQRGVLGLLERKRGRPLHFHVQRKSK